jgi:hypothetical protein
MSIKVKLYMKKNKSLIIKINWRIVYMNQTSFMCKLN